MQGKIYLASCLFLLSMLKNLDARFVEKDLPFNGNEQRTDKKINLFRMFLRPEDIRKDKTNDSSVKVYSSPDSLKIIQDPKTNNEIDRLSAFAYTRRIEFGQTKFLIMHKQRRMFLSVVEKYNWPAAVLGRGRNFKFMLYIMPSGIRVRTVYTMHAGYDLMYSTSRGRIYFDRERDNPRQRWLLSKHQPLYYSGDSITFRNVYYSENFLCYHHTSFSDVGCLKNHDDKWVLLIPGENDADESISEDPDQESISEDPDEENFSEDPDQERISEEPDQEIN